MGSDWRVYSTHPSTQSYDLESIKEISGGVFLVSQRVDYSLEDIIDLVELWGENYRELDHSETLFEVNCAARKISPLASMDYKPNGSFLQSFERKKTGKKKWRHVDSTLVRERYLDKESLLNRVCRKPLLDLRPLHRLFFSE